jgi:hypothetical protein
MPPVPIRVNAPRIGHFVKKLICIEFHYGIAGARITLVYSPIGIACGVVTLATTTIAVIIRTAIAVVIAFRQAGDDCQPIGEPGYPNRREVRRDAYRILVH